MKIAVFLVKIRKKSPKHKHKYKHLSCILIGKLFRPAVQCGVIFLHHFSIPGIFEVFEELEGRDELLMFVK